MVEPNLRFAFEETEMPKSLIEERVQNNMIDAVYGCPNGVIRMSDSMPGLVETSNNLSTVISRTGSHICQMSPAKFGRLGQGRPC